MHSIPQERKDRGRILTILAAVLLAIAGMLLVANTVGCTGGASSDETQTASAEADAPEDLTVPAGTVITVEFVDGLSSETSLAGDRFTARLVDSVWVEDREAVRPGDVIVGTVVEAVPTKKIGGKASLNLSFDALRRSGEDIALSASFVQEGAKQTGKDAATIGGSTAGGALLGRIIGHKQGDEADGTAIGAIVGAAVGTAIAATNEGDPVELPSGVVLDIQLERALIVPGS